MPYQVRRCRGTPFPPECICVDNYFTSAPNVSLNIWYPTLCAGNGIDSSAHPHLVLKYRSCLQMEQIHQLMHILIPLLSQHIPLYVLVLIAPHGILLFLDGVSERIPSGYIWEQRGFCVVLFITVGFPPILDMGGSFEKWKNNLLSIRKVMN